MKTQKNYRFDRLTIMLLSKLKEEFRFDSETDLIQKAIIEYAYYRLNKDTFSNCRNEAIKPIL